MAGVTDAELKGMSQEERVKALGMTTEQLTGKSLYMEFDPDAEDRFTYPWAPEVDFNKRTEIDTDNMSTTEVNERIRLAVTDINRLAESIADVNDKIALTAGIGQPPNDLLDEREHVRIEKLGAEARAAGPMILELARKRPSGMRRYLAALEVIDPRMAETGVRNSCEALAARSVFICMTRMYSVTSVISSTLPRCRSATWPIARPPSVTVRSQRRRWTSSSE